MTEFSGGCLRWDLARIFHASQDAVSFHVVGSEDDPFEGRQAVAARERLGAHGLDVRILPGGHLTTSEHPELLAQIIQEVVPTVTACARFESFGQLAPDSKEWLASAKKQAANLLTGYERKSDLIEGAVA